MPTNPKLDEFIERAKASGASEQALVGILTTRGWPEKEVYETLAAHYEKQTGIEIPRRSDSGTAAKDAFFYLLAFSTLATWTISMGSLAFDLIDKWRKDTLFPADSYPSYSIAWSLASVLIAYPIYLLLTRAIVRQAKIYPEKLNSPVRKWLTYIALVLAAGVFIGDLITALEYFFRGEITSRFLLKVFVVLVISGGVFSYYFADLRKSAETIKQNRFSIDAWAAILSAVAILTMVILGFSSLGPPKLQRTLRADRKRVQDLYQLSFPITAYWKSKNKLPERLENLPRGGSTDPITHTAYEYHAKENGQYDLCATFAQDSQQQSQSGDALPSKSMWSHPSGHYCFSLSADQTVENPYIFFPD